MSSEMDTSALLRITVFISRAISDDSKKSRSSPFDCTLLESAASGNVDKKNRKATSRIREILIIIIIIKYRNRASWHVRMQRSRSEFSIHACNACSAYRKRPAIHDREVIHFGRIHFAQTRERIISSIKMSGLPGRQVDLIETRNPIPRMARIIISAWPKWISEVSI